MARRSSQFPKTTIPQADGLYLRERLFLKLDTRPRGGVLWIGAPAGSGKTALVASYIQQHRIPHLWYQIDAGDSDVASFFHYLASTQKSIRGTALQAFTPQYQGGLEAFARSFFRELFRRLSPGTVVVFDNVQAAMDGVNLSHVLAQAFGELPADLSVVVLSRGDPPEALARCELEGKLARLSSADLALTEQEQVEFLSYLRPGQPLTDLTLKALREGTRGWIAGILLLSKRGVQEIEAALVPGDDKRAVPSRDDRTLLFHYFAAEVFDKLPQEWREFLLVTSVTPRTWPALASELTGSANAKLILDQLVKQQWFTMRTGFVSVSYEYHPLFREFLLAQWRERTSDAIRIRQCARAAQALTKVGDYDSAAALYAQANDVAGVRQLVVECGTRLTNEGRHQTLAEWIATIPLAELERDPWLLYWRAVAHLPKTPQSAYADFAAAFVLFDALDDGEGLYSTWNGVAESLFFSHDDYSTAAMWIDTLHQLRARHRRYPSLEIRVRTVLAMFNLLTFVAPAHSRFNQWRRQAELLLNFMPEPNVRCLAGFSLIRYYAFSGQIGKMQWVQRRMASLATSSAQAWARMLAYWSVLCAVDVSGATEPCDELIREALTLGHASGLLEYELWIVEAATFYHIVRGDAQAAEGYIRRVQANIRPDRRLELGHFHHYAGVVAMLQNDTRTALEHLRFAVQLLSKLGVGYLEAFARTDYGQLLIDRGELEQARVELERAREIAAKTGYRFIEVGARAALAWANFAAGKTAEGVDALREALDLAQRLDMMFFYVRRHVAARLCEEALRYGLAPQFVRAIIKSQKLDPPPQAREVETWPWPVTIRVLGHFELSIDGQLQNLTGSAQHRPMELLKSLIAFGGTRVAQEKITEVLWPDADGDAGVNAFHTTLHRLRKLIGHERAIETHDGLVSINHDVMWVDAWAFETLCGVLTSSLDYGESRGSNEETWSALLRSYRGDFLGAECDRRWSIVYRERLRGKFIQVAQRLGRHWSEQNRIENAAACYMKCIEVDPLLESSYQQLMRILLRAGQRAEAAAVYQRCRNALVSQLGMLPSQSTVSLFNEATGNISTLARLG